MLFQHDNLFKRLFDGLGMEDKLRSELDLNKSGYYDLRIYNSSNQKIGGVNSDNFYEILESIGQYSGMMFIRFMSERGGLTGNWEQEVGELDLNINCILPKSQKKALEQTVSMHNCQVTTIRLLEGHSLKTALGVSKP